MVGNFPPPVHGMAVINETVHNEIKKNGLIPEVINLSAPSLDRSLGERLKRLPRVLLGLWRLVTTRNAYGGMLYMSVSGGLGQVYEILFLLVARLLQMRVFLHHHAFAYLDNKNTLTQILVMAGGKNTTHVVLSPGMANLLQEKYQASRVIPISNSVFLAEKPKSVNQVRKTVRTVGFISNISEDKGVFEFLDLMEAISENNCDIGGRLAGPFQDEQTEQAVRSRLHSLPHVKYVGPQYGSDKEAFYRTIDVLIFPTKYINEAEPVTIHEAISHSIPVIAYGRGCIPEIIGLDCGLVIDPVEPFAPKAADQLQRWSSDASKFREVSNAASARFAQSHDKNMGRREVLLNKILNNGEGQEV